MDSFTGLGDLFFLQYVVLIARELGVPEFISNTAGVWKYGYGKDKAVLLVSFISSGQGGLIRIKSGMVFAIF